MRRTSALLLFTAYVAVATLPGCRTGDRGGETASRSTSQAATVAHEERVPVTAASDEARTLYLRGRELSDQLRFHDARQAFEQAVAKDPTLALAHYDLAITSPSPKEFLAHLDQAVKLSSKASEGERLMILSLQAGANGDSKKSLEYAEELAEKYPQDARALTLLGFSYSSVQDYDKMVTTLSKATEVDPAYAPAYNLLGYGYMPRQKYAEAEAAFKRYIELVPNDPNPYDSYAELLMRTGRFDESIAQYRKALSIDQHFSNAHLGIASNLMYQGRHDAAAAELKKLEDAARDDGDRRTAKLNRAIVYVDQGRTAPAIRELEQLYALDSRLGDTAAMSNDAVLMGDILLEAGQANEAARRYQQALKLAEGSSLAAEQKALFKLADHYNLARVALAKQDTKGAKAHAEQYRTGAEAAEDVGRIRTAHELMGSIALAEKDYDGAIGHLDQADQQDPYVLYRLAMAYQAKGDTTKASELAKRAAEANTLPSLRYAMVRAKAKKLA
jgi:tetratricopeptide (TPR) repeat protein